MSQHQVPQQGQKPRRRRRPPRRNQTTERNEPVQKVVQKEQQPQHLRKWSLVLPISTRAVGVAVGRFMTDLYSGWLDDLYDSDSDSDDNASFVRTRMPNLYKVYRLFLAVFELKLNRVRFDAICINPNVDYYYDYYELPRYCEQQLQLPKHITDIVNALGIVSYGDHTFVPVVAKQVYDTNRKLVPQPLNMLYSNLRTTVVALADPETPEQYRIDFEAHCPIPGAIWENHLLMNADEIMPDEHNIECDLDYIRYRELPASMRGNLNEGTKGSLSQLATFKMRDFKVCPRKVGESLEQYHASCLVGFKCFEGTSFVKLSADQVIEGRDKLMFGEMPQNQDHKNLTLYAVREKYVSAFNWPRFLSKESCGSPICLTLAVSTRGIGFHLSKFLECYKNTETVQPDIYATYRAFLGLFEMKLKPNWMCSRVKSSEIYRSSFVRTNPNLTSTMVISVPDAINRIISAVGTVETDDLTFVMAMASEQKDETGKLIPDPLNLLVSNLRRTVEALSDPETPLEHREHFEKHCPIPGAIWDNHLLANADEIIPPNYSADDLETDILQWIDCASELKGRTISLPLTELTVGSDEADGKWSAFVTTASMDGDVGSMRVRPRRVGEDLSTYVPSVERSDQWRRLIRCWSFVWLTPEETVEGQRLLLGERPTMYDTRPIYALRNAAVCSYEVFENWDIFS